MHATPETTHATASAATAFGLLPPDTNPAPPLVMRLARDFGAAWVTETTVADWLAGGEAPAGFTIDRDCELKAVGEEKAAVGEIDGSMPELVALLSNRLVGGGAQDNKALIDDCVSKTKE